LCLRLPLELLVEAPKTVALEDKAGRVVSSPMDVARGTPRTDILATFFPAENCFLSQRTTIVVTNPLTVTPIAASAGELTLRIENQGSPFSGFIQIQHMDA